MEIQENIVLQNETNRIVALRKYAILDTPPDGCFETIVRLAANLLNVPIAIISLVDTDRIWFKSRHGIEAAYIERETGLCASVILSDDFYLVEDAKNDTRTLANSLVVGKFGLRFYAAFPLKTAEGFNLGTLCVLDRIPRKFTDIQINILRDLRDIVMDQIELRLNARYSHAKQNQLLHIAVRDLKNPLSSIGLRAEMIKNLRNDHTAIQEVCDRIIETSARMKGVITTLLNSSHEDNTIHLNLKELDFVEIVMRAISINRRLADHKNLHLTLRIDSHPRVFADEDRLYEIADNLINNAIKYSPRHKNITISIQQRGNTAVLDVADEGPGILAEDRAFLFEKFGRLNAQPTGKENSTGLGLSIVKILVEAHGGHISVTSDEKDKGSVFKVEIPVIDEPNRDNYAQYGTG